MKHQNLNRIVALLSFIIIGLFSYAQSISGSIRDFESTDDLGYANVDIYKGDKLVASVLADKEGNFNVSLDTGIYRAEINYAGYKKMVQDIRVNDDEEANFGLKKDKNSKFAKEKKGARDIEDIDKAGYGKDMRYSDDIEVESPAIEKSHSRGDGVAIKSRPLMLESTTMAMKHSSGIMRGDYREPQQGVAGKLTAGEINDFSKWELWGDLKKDELNKYQQSWKYNPANRYLVQVTDQSGLPIANVKVDLVNKAGQKFYSARTDNTGKAELWGSVLLAQQSSKEKLSVSITHLGNTYLIKKARKFDKGINSFIVEAKCNQSQKVDIAFVVDATGSMSDELHYLRAELNDVMFKSKEMSTTLDFSFANVFYRDHTDAYLTRTQDFTRVLSESVSFISDQRAGGGGDFPEAVEVALDTAINELSWRDDARTRIVFLILDAPPHNTSEIQEKLTRISKQAAEKGIRIVPLVASGIDKGTEYLMRSIALATNGTYAFLTDHSGVGGTHLKPSTDKFKVETLNDLLVRVIKSYTYMPDCKQELPDLDLEYPDSSVQYPIVTDSTQIDTTTAGSVTPVKVEWTYYPNPTRGIVNIRASVSIKELYITDLSGKVLQVLKDIPSDANVQADLSGYASGIYLIRYPVGQQWVSGKVVLVRN